MILIMLKKRLTQGIAVAVPPSRTLQRGSDVLGSAIFDANPKNGFFVCVIATTVLYAAIVPLILLAPSHVVATRDGERNPALEADVRAEISMA